MKSNYRLSYFLLLLFVGLMVGCGDDMKPEVNEEEEEISEVVLTFTPDSGEDAVVATWLDPDGEGSAAPMIEEIELEEGVTYTLTMTFANTLGTTAEDITSEIQAEAEEHMFFFAFTDGSFTDPAGDGNVDNRSDAVNYNDTDTNGLPVGLSTTWTAGEHTETEGEFRVVLKHQPDVKSATSSFTTGGTDVDIVFPLHIAEESHAHNEEEEVINEIVLTFTPTAGGSSTSASWFDADGEGVANPTIEDIMLSPNTEYDLAITLQNTLGMEVEDITAEILEEADEHMFFFGFTADIFNSPPGDGNIDGRSDPLNYNDQDSNSLPVGLSTKWTTGSTMNGDFRLVLKHQPDLKTTDSDSSVGGTDVDISYSIKIQ